MSWEEVSDLCIPGMQLSRTQSMYLALLGIHARPWGDAWVSRVCSQLLGQKTCLYVIKCHLWLMACWRERGPVC